MFAGTTPRWWASQVPQTSKVKLADLIRCRLQYLSILQNNKSTGGEPVILIYAFYQVVGAAVEEMLQPKLNGLKAKSN